MREYDLAQSLHEQLGLVDELTCSVCWPAGDARLGHRRARWSVLLAGRGARGVLFESVA